MKQKGLQTAMPNVFFSPSTRRRSSIESVGREKRIVAGTQSFSASSTPDTGRYSLLFRFTKVLEVLAGTQSFSP